MYEFSKEISRAEDQLIAQVKSYSVDSEYTFERLEYPNIYIPNRSAAWGISLLPEDSERKKELRRLVDQYNQYIDTIESIPGFLDAFIDNNLCLSRSFISEQWSEETAKLVFSKPKAIFSTDLAIINDCLFDKTVIAEYEVVIEDETVALPIGQPAWIYADKIKGKKAFWNWVDNGHDFCSYLWEILGSRYRKDNETWDDTDENEVVYSFDYYDEFRGEDPEPQLVRIFNKLERLGYVHSYTIKPCQYDPRWKYSAKSDASVDLALVDPAFLKNKLLMEQIELLLWTPADELQKLPYFLTEKDGSQKLSSEPGKLGGHNGLKIYGRLDCPSAARYLNKGQYVRHRVFFEDEEAAIAAGYRPCAKCMPEAYKKWKAIVKT